MIHLAGHDLMLLLVSYGYWAVLVIVGMESLGLPLPGETTLVAAGMYAGASHRLSIGLVILLRTDLHIDCSKPQLQTRTPTSVSVSPRTSK